MASESFGCQRRIAWTAHTLLSWMESEMSNAENLRKIFHDVQENGKFEKYEFLAVLSNLIDIADRLDRVEIACKVEGS